MVTFKIYNFTWIKQDQKANIDIYILYILYGTLLNLEASKLWNEISHIDILITDKVFKRRLKLYLSGWHFAGISEKFGANICLQLYVNLSEKYIREVREKLTQSNNI